ncbi:MAG: SH3 domain-containing protein [Lachnospiraceae bacterium]
MRHNRRAVMTERYKLYMKKNIFNGRYFVRNLQIGICIILAVVLAVGAVVLVNTDDSSDIADAGTRVSAKEALFGNSEVAEHTDVASNDVTTAEIEETEEKTEGTAITSEATTEVLAAATKTASDYIEMSKQYAATQEKKSEFDGKCIAKVEETLNIRKDPSTDAEFVGSMDSGAIAIVEGTEGEWTKIKSGDVEGYVLTDYILTGESAEQYAKDYVTLRGTVLEDGVNVRAEQSTDADILTVLEKDDTITVLENPEEEDTLDETTVTAMAETADGTDEKSTEISTEQTGTETESTEVPNAEESITWLPVMLEDGQTGYVSADLVDVDKLYAIAVSAEELERRAAEKAAAEKAAAEAAAAAQQTQMAYNNTSNNSSSTQETYQGATTTPVTATESGECIGTFTITAYCGCKKCSGGHSKTASGTTPTEGRTIAADTSILPFGTKVVIDGIVYTVEDRGSGVSGNHIDIFFATHEKAVAFGTKTVKVYKY